MMAWGIISTLTAAVQSYAGLVVVRFFLGFVEAAYFVCIPAPVTWSWANSLSPAVYTSLVHGILVRSWVSVLRLYTPVLYYQVLSLG